MAAFKLDPHELEALLTALIVFRTANGRPDLSEKDESTFQEVWHWLLTTRDSQNVTAHQSQRTIKLRYSKKELQLVGLAINFAYNSDDHRVSGSDRVELDLRLRFRSRSVVRPLVTVE